MQDKRTGGTRASTHTPQVRLSSPEEASQRLNPKIVTPSWLREMCRRREIDFTKIAGKIAFTEQQLAALVEKYMVPAGPVEKATEPRRRKTRQTTTTDAPAVVQLRARPPQRLRRAVGDGRD